MPFHAYLQGVGYALGFVAILAGSYWLGGIPLALAVIALGIYACHLFLPGFGLAPFRGRKGQGRVAITFDDGPNGAVTDTVLDVLQKHGARATFFVVGNSVRKEPDRIARMARDGHEIGNHTMQHTIVTFQGPRAIENEIAATQAALADAGVPRPKWFRAPHGFKSPFLYSALKKHGLTLVAWTRGVWDTDNPGANIIVKRAVGTAGEALTDGEILLLHDGENGLDRSQTAQALDGILAACKRRGLKPVTLSELLGTP